MKKLFSLFPAPGSFRVVGYFLFSLLPLAAQAQGFEDPLKGLDPESAILKLIAFILGFVVLLAILGVVYGGFTYITAYGNDQRVGQAKKIIFWSIMGLIVVVMSQLLVGLVGSALTKPGP